MIDKNSSVFVTDGGVFYKGEWGDINLPQGNIMHPQDVHNAPTGAHNAARLKYAAGDARPRYALPSPCPSKSVRQMTDARYSALLRLTVHWTVNFAIAKRYASPYSSPRFLQKTLSGRKICPIIFGGPPGTRFSRASRKIVHWTIFLQKHIGDSLRFAENAARFRKNYIFSFACRQNARYHAGAAKGR